MEKIPINVRLPEYLVQALDHYCILKSNMLRYRRSGVIQDAIEEMLLKDPYFITFLHSPENKQLRREFKLNSDRYRQKYNK